MSDADQPAHSTEHSTGKNTEQDVEQDMVADTFNRMRKAAARGGRKPPPLLKNRRPRPQPVMKQNNETYLRLTGNPNLQLFTKRPRRTHRFGDILKQEIENRGWNRVIVEGWIVSNWDKVVGTQVAKHSRVFQFKDTSVFVKCDSTAWATQLRYMTRNMLDVIAAEVGEGVVTEIKIFGPDAPSWRKGPLHVKGRGPRDTYG